MSLFEVVRKNGQKAIVDGRSRATARQTWMDAHGGEVPQSVRPYRPQYHKSRSVDDSGSR